MKVLQLPHHNNVQGNNGVEQVVLHYGKHLPEFGVELVPHNSPTYDLLAVHAGCSPPVARVPLVAHCHGLHWYVPNLPRPFYGVNRDVIDSVRHAKIVTVPSDWVAEPFRRDMHMSPVVVPHGIEWDEWQDPTDFEAYVLWNKNRVSPACSPEDMQKLAEAFPEIRFVTTFGKDTGNVKVIGTKPFAEMKRIVKKAGIYLSLARETFGIGTLEAMASGVPVLGYAYGGNLDLVQHGISGYLAEPGNLDDLAAGLDYCIRFRDVLGENGRELSQNYSWRHVCELLAQTYQQALVREDPRTCIVIPTYNYAGQVGRAVESAIDQTFKHLSAVIVVDDGSTDNTPDVMEKLIAKHKDHGVPIVYHRKDNGGVATARNTGVRIAINEYNAQYIACLDADDAISKDFLSKTVPPMEHDPSLGIAYTGLTLMLPDGRRGRGKWPSDCDFDAQVQGRNQVPTCCVFRAECWKRLGGFRQRYAPKGMGAEDAEFWLRVGASGWGIRQVTTEPLFIYTYGVGGTTGDPDYKEPDWLGWHPWTHDKQHPFASLASPENGSHPVRSYSEPTVSVVIPVGPHHIDHVWNAMDSLEAQTFRNWEAVVVFDTGETSKEIQEFSDAFPFAKILFTDKKGAGFARNRGAEIARSPFLVFLDADDWLYPDFLEAVLRSWDENESIIYTDYVARAIISEEQAEEYYQTGRLYNWNPETSVGVIGANKEKPSFYDCELAQQQPKYTGDADAPVYHWCLVTCLIPKAWHDEIGGFDEQLPTWEDVLYHWMLARRGRCYTHHLEELLVYNFHYGTRREAGLTRQTFETVVQYISKRLEEVELMACKGCGNKASSMNVASTRGPVYDLGTQANPFFDQPQQRPLVSDDEMVLVEYVSPKKGTHPVHGMTDDPATGMKRFYGMRAGGDRFLVHKLDIWDRYGNHVAKHFQPVVQEIKARAPVAFAQPEQPKRESVRVPPPIRLNRPVAEAATIIEEAGASGESVPESDGGETVRTLPGVTEEIAEQLISHGWTTYEAILKAGAANLQTLKGVGPMRAETLVSYCQMVMEQESA